MTFFIYATLLLLAAVCGIVILRGFQRWHDHVAVSSVGSAEKNVSGNIAESASSARCPRRKNSRSYLEALRTNNPEELAKAPLPEHFSEELLLQALLRIQNQPSLYDFFLERLTQQFTISQYERLVSAWTRYCNGLGEGMASQNAFLQQLSERLTMHLETQRRAASLEADTDEENLRGSKARHDRRQLLEPLQKQKTPRDEAQEEIQVLRQQLAQVDAEIETKESESATLDKEQHPNKANVLERELNELDRLRTTIQRKIFNLRGQWGL